jgi:hypothetical protein
MSIGKNAFPSSFHTVQTYLGSEFLGELLYPVLLDTVEDDDAVDLVERGNELLGPNHLGCNGRYGASGQGKRASEEVERDAVIVGSVGEQVGSESLFLDFPARRDKRESAESAAVRSVNSSFDGRRNSPGKLLLDLGGIVQQRPDLDGQDEVPGLLPLTVLQSLAGLHDVVPSALGRTHESLPVGLLEQPPERPADRLSLGLVRVERGQKGNLDQHGRHEEGGLEQLEVDVHVEGQETPLFDKLLLRGVVRESLDSLGQKLLGTLRGKDFEQGRLTLGHETLLERGQTDLDDDSVVQDLGRHIGVLDGSLEMAHQEHVTSLVVLAVGSVVVDVTEHGTGSDECRGVTVEVDGERVDEVVGALRSREVGHSRCFTGQRRDGASLENLNNGRGLSRQKRRTERQSTTS